MQPFVPPSAPITPSPESLLPLELPLPLLPPLPEPSEPGTPLSSPELGLLAEPPHAAASTKPIDVAKTRCDLFIILSLHQEAHRSGAGIPNGAPTGPE